MSRLSLEFFPIAMVNSENWPAFNVERRAITDLKPYKNNARTHSKEQVQQIAASMKEWGFTNPILVDEDGMIIAGHGRLDAAKALGVLEVPTIVAKGWNDAQKRAYVLADNQLALNAGWNEDLLRLEIGGLQELKFDIDLLGFGDDFLSGLFATKEGKTDPDDVPAAPEKPFTKLGDVWMLGDHRIICGDSTDPCDVGKVMAGKLANICFTSPPYGQQRTYGGDLGDWDKLMQGVFSVLPTSDKAQVLVNLGMIHTKGEWQPYWEMWVEWMRSIGWKRFGWYIWDQGPGLPGDWNGRLAPSHEFIFHFNKVSERARKTKPKLAASIQFNDHGNGMRKKDGTMSGVSSPEKSLQTHKVPDSVIRVMRHKARGIECKHPAVFPIALPVEVLTAFSNAGEICFEPFCGSGTSIIAGETCDRKIYAIELNPTYVDIAVKRWQEFTGKIARRESDGLIFTEAA